jgi:hypothetical protein
MLPMMSKEKNSHELFLAQIAGHRMMLKPWFN